MTRQRNSDSSVQGAEVFYEAAGSGEPVIFIHGRTGTHASWSHLAPELSHDCLVVTYDSRGVGRSPMIPGDYTVPALADDLAGLMDVLELKSATLVGISMGGAVAQAFALRYPARTRSLVLVSTGSEFSAQARQRFLDQADEAERDGMTAIAAGQLSRWFTEEFLEANPGVGERMRRSVEQIDPHLFALRSRANAERSFTPQLDQITGPVTFIGGACDPGGMKANAERFLDRLPDCEAHVVPNASHLLTLEVPRTFIGLVRGHLARLKDLNQLLK